MNAATRAAIRYCIRQGHTPLAIQNGFDGLLEDDVLHLTWLDVDNWMARRGSALGTSYTLSDINLGAVAFKFNKYRFNALLVIGDVDAFNALSILDNGKLMYPSFRIPMVHLPATISNNVPMTEFSVGSDTALNAIVHDCDTLMQSASSSRNTVFLVHTPGENCGYLAAMSALAVSLLVAFILTYERH
jgi:6-phosphofructokinase 1